MTNEQTERQQAVDALAEITSVSGCDPSPRYGEYVVSELEKRGFTIVRKENV